MSAIDFPVNDCLFLEPDHTEQDKLISFSEIILCDNIFTVSQFKKESLSSDFYITGFPNLPEQLPH